jgi:hypothetical protein
MPGEGQRKGRGRAGWILSGTHTTQGQAHSPPSLLSQVVEHLSLLLTTDLRMLTRGLGMGLEGLFSKLSGSVEECPPFLACSASW